MSICFFQCLQREGWGGKGPSIILWLLWRMIICCLRRWEKHQEGALIKMDRKQESWSTFLCKETKWRFCLWSCKCCHFLLECTNEQSHLSGWHCVIPSASVTGHKIKGDKVRSRWGGVFDERIKEICASFFSYGLIIPIRLKMELFIKLTKINVKNIQRTSSNKSMRRSQQLSRKMDKVKEKAQWKRRHIHETLHRSQSLHYWPMYREPTSTHEDVWIKLAKRLSG